MTATGSTANNRATRRYIDLSVRAEELLSAGGYTAIDDAVSYRADRIFRGISSPIRYVLSGTFLSRIVETAVIARSLATKQSRA